MEPFAALRGSDIDRSDVWLRRVGGFAALPGLLAARGVAPAQVLSVSGLAADALELPARQVGFAASARVLSEAVQATGCEHFGVLAGSETHLDDLGFLGSEMRSAVALGPALRSLAAHHHHICTGGAVLLQEQERMVRLGYVVFHPNLDNLGPAHDYAAAAGVSLIRQLCGQDWNPGEVLLPRRRPANPRPYQAFFRCPLQFDAELCELRFPTGALNQGLLPTAGKRQVVATPPDLRVAGEHLLPQLYRAARMQLLQGEAGGEQIASMLGLHRRSLSRRLEACGQSFQRVLDDVRYMMARELLADTDLPVVDIALALGYAEASPFVRAFRRWSGHAPTQWRTRYRGDPNSRSTTPPLWQA